MTIDLVADAAAMVWGKRAVGASGEQSRISEQPNTKYFGATPTVRHAPGVDTELVDASGLVFEVGDRVTGWGRMVADDEGQWLDLSRVASLGLSVGPRPRSRRSVRLQGADPRSVPRNSGANNAVPGHVGVIGIWRGDAIEVESQLSDGPDRPVQPSWTIPPCPAPAGGWPRGGADENPIFDLGDLSSSGAAVTVVIFRPAMHETVLVVASTDDPAVEAVLRPQLGQRLCVVRSRCTRPELDRVRAYFLSRYEEFAVDTVAEPIDEQAQPAVEVELLRVTDQLAAWAEPLADGILLLHPALTPV